MQHPEKVTLSLALTLESGHEVRAAKDLRARLPAPQWRLLAALAAEIVQEHETAQGATVVVVAGAAQAERVLRELRRDQPALVPPL